MRFALIFIILCYPTISYANILKIFSSNNAPILLPSENNFNISHPLSILDEKNTRLTLIYEVENIYKLEKNNEVKYSINASTKKKSELLYLHNPASKKKKTGFLVTEYNNSGHFFIDDKIKNTSLEMKGAGKSFAIAKQSGKYSFGLYANNSISNADGASQEITDNISILSPDAKIIFSAKERKSGWQIGYSLNKKFSLHYLKYNFHLPLNLKLQDSNNPLWFPINFSGSGREINNKIEINKKWQLYVSSLEGGGNAFDDYYYKQLPNFGKNILNTEFQSWNLNLTGKISQNTVLVLGTEDYSGKLFGNGILEVGKIAGGFFDFLGGYYLYHYNANLNYSGYKFLIKRRIKKFTFTPRYELRALNLNIHLDGVQKILFGFIKRNSFAEDIKLENIKLHTFSLGVEKKIGKNKSIQYILVQHIPQVPKSEEEKIAGIPKEKEAITKKVSGGTLQIISINFLF